MHLWIVGVVSLLWNAFGAMDYAMTQFMVESYMSEFTAEQLDYFYSFPAWADAAWTLGVWACVAGSIGLLLRKSWARWAFLIFLLSLAGGSTYTLVLTDRLQIMGGAGVAIFSLVIWTLTAGLFFYARRRTAQGVLRP
jgi:hypothetical protein